MTELLFNTQLERLKFRFGEKAFDTEFAKLLGFEVSSMADDAFIKLVDTMIGSRPHNRPPTLVDFREMKHHMQKKHFDNLVDKITHGPVKDLPPLKDMLDKNYPGCTSLKDAFNAERDRLSKEKK